MKFGAVYCIYDDHEYLETSLDSIKKYLNKVLFLISDVPWNGKVADNSETIKKIKELCSKNKNFELIQGHWENEIDQRNFGLSRFFAENIDIAVIIDSDEIYHELHFVNILNFIQQNPQFAAFHIEWNTYWKKSYHRIHPREYYKPVIAVKVSSFLFDHIRAGTTAIIRTPLAILKTQGEYNYVLISPEIAFCYHLSYARTDEHMKRKLETNSHAPEFIKDWYDKVWNRWQFQMRNLHPVTPQQYQIAVEENITTLPAALQLHIKKERMIVKGHRRLCSIIVLNWNSCELLKRCIQLIIDTTTNYELIVVDNGSTKDDSVEYINSIVCKKVFNKENLGFAGGVNSGLKVKAKNSDVCLLNVDAEVQQGWLENLYETLMKYPTCGLVGPLGNEVASGYQKEGYVEEDTEVANLHGFCMLIMKEVYDKIGLFDERFKLGGYDDNDYGMRTLIAGWTLYLSAKSLVRHKAHQVFKLNGLDYLDIDPINNEVFKNKIYNILLNYSKIFDLYQYEDLARFVKLKI